MQNDMQNVFLAKPAHGQEADKALYDKVLRDNALQSVFAPETTHQLDSIAQKEATLLAEGFDIEKDGKKQEHHRHQAFRNHVNKATIGLFWIVAISLLAGIATYVWHMLTPVAYHYLNNGQLSEIKTVIVTAITSSALTQYVKKRMD